jgi:two-component system, cell cycle sensor histidine kinase and response regulator CckA
MHFTPRNDRIRVLLIEDDEDDYLLTKSLLSEIKGQSYDVHWSKNYPTGLAAAIRNEHDVCLVDYRLGAHDGIELMRNAVERGCTLPIILLTGQGEHEIDLQAMNAGASDYLVKRGLEAGLLERSIRYAIGRHRAAAQAAADQTRLAGFGATVGLALTRRDSLQSILQRCCGAMREYLDVDLARIWTYDTEHKALELQASAGEVDDLSRADTYQPNVALDLKLMAKGHPVFIKQLVGDGRLEDKNWAIRERFVSAAFSPLVLEERLVGVMAIFSRSPVAETIVQEMSSVTNGIALYIERKRSEQALGASEVKYRTVIENVEEVIFQLDDGGCWTFLNPAWTRITGFSVEEALGRPFAEFVHPEDRAEHRERMLEVIGYSTSFYRGEVRYLTRNGNYRWVQVYAHPTLNGESHSSGTSGTISDITERKRAEAETQKLAAFTRCNPDPVMELDAKGKLTYANDAARKMAESLGVRDIAAILPPNAADIAIESLATRQNKLHCEIMLDGQTLTWSFFPILPSKVVHCYGANITDRLNLETQFRHAQKLESIGQLAAGVAHDFNNILTIIQGHSDRLIAQCEGEPFLVDSLTQVSTAATRASSLTRQLLVFSRKQVMQPRVLDLNGVLGNLTKMLHRLLGEDIALESSCEPKLPPIEGDTGMIEQIIMNLVVNSRDAMPRGGGLTISTKSVEVDEAYMQHCSEARPGRFVCLSVRDTGCGMSKQTLDRIFEPFFTTKDVGKGTGLGLATVYGIVKQHQGWVEVTSELKVGTTFRVFLPVSLKPLDSMLECPASPKHVRGGRETILLVEDEPVLRELASAILKDYDYEVLEAAHGEDALRVWNERDGRVDLLLTDMVMPGGMTGRDLAEQLRARKPELKVIFTSGYSVDVMQQDMHLPDTLFLQKPYPPPMLAQAVRTSLDRKHSAAGARPEAHQGRPPLAVAGTRA